MKNVHLLPTDKSSKLSILNNGKLNFGAEIMSSSNSKLQHIYITSSDEGIKEGDWFIHPDSSCFDKEWKEISIGGYEILQVIKVDENFIYHSSMMAIHKNLNIKKIILTTDPTLILYGVQPIEDYFLEWFVKNPSCEFVETQCSGRNCIEDFGCTKEGCNGVEPLEIIIPQEELKQETLEEAAEKFTQTWFQNNDFTKELFIKGANWQAERMYSEEDIHKIVESYQNTMENNPTYITYNQWFEQFKKK
jgi:hypothetical protein